MESRKESNHPTPHESAVLFGLRRDRSSLFSQMPRDITRLVSAYCDFDTNSEINLALQHAADARQEHVDALLGLLEKKPHLLLQRGRVITPGGHDIRDVTLYEYCLGAGDPELAEKIQAYFTRITGIDGEAERVRQYEPYRLHIDAILTQEPYDIRPLIEIIKKASAADVTALLNNDMTHESALRDAIIQFRKDHAPKIITAPCMHFNYRSLLHALELLEQEWNNLFLTSGSNDDKICLVWQQLIGFEMRRMPGIDRCQLAQGLRNNKRERTYKYKNDSGNFPLTLTDESIVDLGGDSAADIYSGLLRSSGLNAATGVNMRALLLQSLYKTKASYLQHLCNTDSPSQSARAAV